MFFLRCGYRILIWENCKLLASTGRRIPKSIPVREKITLLFNLLLLLFSLHPLTPQFQCCFFFQTGVAKRSVYFETSVPQQRAVNIEIGGRGARRRAKTHINTKSVIFSRTGLLLEHNYAPRDRINCSFMNTNVHIALNV